MDDVLLRKADELTGACRDFFEGLKIHLKKENKETFYAKEIRQQTGLSVDRLKKYLIELNRKSYLKIVGGNKYKSGFEYQVCDYEEYNRLKNNITKVLDELLESIKQKYQNNKEKCSSAEVVQKKVRTTQKQQYQAI